MMIHYKDQTQPQPQPQTPIQTQPQPQPQPQETPPEGFITDLEQRPDFAIGDLLFPEQNSYLYEDAGPFQVLHKNESKEEIISHRPMVFLHHNAHAKIKHYVRLCDKEVGFLIPTMKMTPNAPHFLCYDAFLYYQQVTGVEVDAEGEEMTRAFKALAQEYPEQFKGKAYNVAHGHSHVNMGVAPSGTDWKQRRDKTQLGWDVDYRIFLIFNKRGDVRADIIQYYPMYAEFLNVDVGIAYMPFPGQVDWTKGKEVQRLKDEVETFVFNQPRRYASSWCTTVTDFDKLRTNFDKVQADLHSELTHPGFSEMSQDPDDILREDLRTLTYLLATLADSMIGLLPEDYKYSRPRLQAYEAFMKQHGASDKEVKVILTSDLFPGFQKAAAEVEAIITAGERFKLEGEDFQAGLIQWLLEDHGDENTRLIEWILGIYGHLDCIDNDTEREIAEDLLIALDILAE